MAENDTELRELIAIHLRAWSPGRSAQLSEEEFERLVDDTLRQDSNLVDSFRMFHEKFGRYPTADEIRPESDPVMKLIITPSL